MRRAQLSQRERDSTPRIVKALSAEGFVVSNWGWKFLPEADEWYFLVRERDGDYQSRPGRRDARAERRAGKGRNRA